MDPQSAAYRLTTDHEPGGVAELVALGVVEPVDTTEPIPDRDDFALPAGNPKTRDEAVAAARSRGDDPTPYLGEE